MDPNTTLAELREYVRKVLYAPEELDNDDIGDEICERFEALDNWIARGGFLPDAWKQ